jgi:hypothetical protein
VPWLLGTCAVFAGLAWLASLKVEPKSRE